MDDKVDTPLLQGPNKPTNITILLVTTCAFGVFVIAEIIGALASNSLSLLGDGAAMSVDVFTYFSNMYAERQKALNGGKLSIQQKRVLEIYIPTFSVTALLGVTGYILSDAIAVFQQGDDDNVNVYFLFGFAGGNFLVDIVSSLMFYWKGREVLISGPISRERQSIDFGRNKEGFLHVPNLNMISALTHVGSDTLRTTSVFIAAIVSKVGNIETSICDAWAAVVITITICFAVIPLIKEIYHAVLRIEAEAKDAAPDMTERPSLF